MQQPVTRALFGYWDALRQARPMPDRTDIDPGAIRALLPDVFLLTLDSTAGHPIRIAGTAICAAFARELAHSPFASLWPDEQRAGIGDFVRDASRQADGAVATVTGHNDCGETLDLEMILLPLSYAGAAAGRMLGALAPMASPYWLGTRPLQSLQFVDWRNIRHAGGVGTRTNFAAHRHFGLHP